MDAGDAEPSTPNLNDSTLLSRSLPVRANTTLQVFYLQLRYWLAHQELETIEQVGTELGSECCLFLEQKSWPRVAS